MRSQSVGHDLAIDTLKKKKKLGDIYILARQDVKAHLNSPGQHLLGTPLAWYSR